MKKYDEINRLRDLIIETVNKIMDSDHSSEDKLDQLTLIYSHVEDAMVEAETE